MIHWDEVDSQGRVLVQLGTDGPYRHLHDDDGDLELVTELQWEELINSV